MAEPQPPARRRSPGKVLGLAGAILVIVLGGLFLARPASAATTAPAQPVAHSQPVGALRAGRARRARTRPWQPGSARYRGSATSAGCSACAPAAPPA